MGLLLAGNIYADMKMLPKGTTVNQLIKDGYTLIDTDSVAWQDKEGFGSVGTFYHLMKKSELVSCGVGNGKVSCWKP